MAQVYAAMSSMSMSIRGNSRDSTVATEESSNIPSSSSIGSLKKGEDAAVEFSKKRDE
jgi:hypothetical protein